MHAVQINHLRHHRHCLNEDDVEAMSARMPAWRAILVGPLFPLHLHRKAFEVATRRQRNYHLEHHLFPSVPTCRLPQLAERLDRAVPGLEKQRVF
jgi:fatty acid desaturase